MKHFIPLLYCAVPPLSPSHTHTLCLALLHQYGIGFLILFYEVWSVRLWLAASKHIALGKVMAPSLTPNCCWVGISCHNSFLLSLLSLSPPDSRKHSHGHLASSYFPPLYLGTPDCRREILTDMSVPLPCLPNVTFVSF